MKRFRINTTFLAAALLGLLVAAPSIAANLREFTKSDEHAAFGGNLYVAGDTRFGDELSFSDAASEIVGGATSFAIRNNADSANNLICTNAGVCTIRAGAVVTAGGATVTAGDVTATNGEVILSTSGKTVALQEATAAAACMGTLTCNGASDVVTSTTCATTGSRIFLTRTSLDADTTGDAYVKSISTGVSFTVACEASDTGTMNWIIFHEAA